MEMGGASGDEKEAKGAKMKPYGLSVGKESKGHDDTDSKKVLDYIIKALWIITGTFFLCLGVIGIFIPILPTTPFLLLAAACYAKGSKRFYHWLTNNKWFGKYIKNYREGNGLSLKAKIVTISLLWTTILLTTFLVIDILIIQIILIVIAICVTIHIFTIKTFKEGDA